MPSGLNHSCKGFHAIYGYLQVGSVDKINSSVFSEWSQYHPHITRGRNASELDHVYTAVDNLSFLSGLEGYGVFRYDQKLILTKSECKKSRWSLPTFMKQYKISYHTELSWKEDYFVEQGAKALTYGSSIEWLLLSQVSLECAMINRGEIPLSVYREPKGFKLYFSDVGLLMAITRVPYMTMAREHEHNLFKGAISENYVAQQLKANGHELYYWKSNTHEVDFIKNEPSTSMEVER